MGFYLLGLALVAGLAVVQGSSFDIDELDTRQSIRNVVGRNYLARMRREAEAKTAAEVPEDPECRQYDLTATPPTSPECCTCTDCRLAGLKEDSIEKCEGVLKPEADAIFATMAAQATNGSAPANSSGDNSDVFTPEKVAAIKSIRECMTECVFNESGYLTNLRLNEQAIMKDFKEGFKDPKWAPIAQKTYTKCMDVAKKSVQGRKCKSGAEDFMQCLAREKYLSCPQGSWNQNVAECQKIKERLTKCPSVSPPY